MQKWKARVRNVYASVDELRAYDDIYNIAKKCGFDCHKKLWEENPLIGGTTDPRDFGAVEEEKIN
jgi:hypothetical protein